jgi:hypothetical protein
MAGKIAIGDYVRIRDLAGHPHIGKVQTLASGNREVFVRLLTGMGVARPRIGVEKIPDTEAMLLKLLENVK